MSIKLIFINFPFTLMSFSLRLTRDVSPAILILANGYLALFNVRESEETRTLYSELMCTGTALSTSLGDEELSKNVPTKFPLIFYMEFSTKSGQPKYGSDSNCLVT